MPRDARSSGAEYANRLPEGEYSVQWRLISAAVKGSSLLIEYFPGRNRAAGLDLAPSPEEVRHRVVKHGAVVHPRV